MQPSRIALPSCRHPVLLFPPPVPLVSFDSISQPFPLISLYHLTPRPLRAGPAGLPARAPPLARGQQGSHGGRIWLRQAGSGYRCWFAWAHFTHAGNKVQPSRSPWQPSKLHFPHKKIGIRPARGLPDTPALACGSSRERKCSVRNVHLSTECSRTSRNLGEGEAGPIQAAAGLGPRSGFITGHRSLGHPTGLPMTARAGRWLSGTTGSRPAAQANTPDPSTCHSSPDTGCPQHLQL